MVIAHDSKIHTNSYKVKPQMEYVIDVSHSWSVPYVEKA